MLASLAEPEPDEVDVGLLPAPRTAEGVQDGSGVVRGGSVVRGDLDGGGDNACYNSAAEDQEDDIDEDLEDEDLDMEDLGLSDEDNL